MLSIKKIDELLKDKSFIEYLERIYDLKVKGNFTIFKDTRSIYKNGSFKTIDITKSYIITANTNKTFNLHMSKKDFEIHYKKYKNLMKGNKKDV